MQSTDSRLSETTCCQKSLALALLDLTTKANAMLTFQRNACTMTDVGAHKQTEDELLFTIDTFIMSFSYLYNIHF